MLINLYIKSKVAFHAKFSCPTTSNRQVTSQIQVELLQIYFRESSPQPAALNKQVNDPAF